jgi:hypothetical protein
MNPVENMELWSYYMAYNCIWDKHFKEQVPCFKKKAWKTLHQYTPNKKEKKWISNAHPLVELDFTEERCDTFINLAFSKK